MKPCRPADGRHRFLFSPRAFHRDGGRHPAAGFLFSPKGPGALEFNCPDMVNIRKINRFRPDGDTARATRPAQTPSANPPVSD